MIKETHLSRFGFISTEASCSAITHFLKIIVFGLWGISLAGYWQILSMMVVSTFVGAYLGSQILGRIQENHFKLVIRIIITLLALRLLYVGVFG